MRRLSEVIPVVRDCDPEFATFSGSRSSPEDVLKAVDDVLKSFGLEIVQHPCDRPDQYVISIDRRDHDIEWTSR